jgi:cytoskeletal protein CcmA (bactofilin family)
MKLFSKKLNADSYTGLIPLGTHIAGNINWVGVLKVQGSCNGQFATSSNEDENCIILDTGGMLTFDEITSSNAIIGGVVNARQLRVTHTLRVLSTASISGAVIYYRHLEIEPGAKIHDCQLRHLDQEDTAQQV